MCKLRYLRDAGGLSVGGLCEDGTTTIDGFIVVPAELQRLMIVIGGKNRKHHLHKMRKGNTWSPAPVCQPVGASYRQKEVVGPLYSHVQNDVSMDHNDSFCQGCKAFVKRQLGRRFSNFIGQMVGDYPMAFVLGKETKSVSPEFKRIDA